MCSGLVELELPHWIYKRETKSRYTTSKCLWHGYYVLAAIIGTFLPVHILFSLHFIVQDRNTHSFYRINHQRIRLLSE